MEFNPAGKCCKTHTSMNLHWEAMELKYLYTNSWESWMGGFFWGNAFPDNSCLPCVCMWVSASCISWRGCPQAQRCRYGQLEVSWMFWRIWAEQGKLLLPKEIIIFFHVLISDAYVWRSDHNCENSNQLKFRRLNKKETLHFWGGRS